LRPSTPHEAAMLADALINATGLFALTLNVSGVVRPNDRRLLRTAGWASALWAVNNVLIGAHTAAALSVLSVGRQWAASALHGKAPHLRSIAFATIALLTFLIGWLSWSGVPTLFPVAGSLIGSYAMLFMEGTRLRIALVVINAFWIHNALSYGAWWQAGANVVAGTAAAVGAWRACRP
jgi:hypothetical protein